jgi:hypothetical protein
MEVNQNPDPASATHMRSTVEGGAVMLLTDTVVVAQALSMAIDTADRGMAYGAPVVRQQPKISCPPAVYALHRQRCSLYVTRGRQCDAGRGRDHRR